MPRYRFTWSNLPEYLLSELAAALDFETHGDAANALREIYGARPQEEFIEDTWDLLREVWLPEDGEARAEIAATLRERGLGDSLISDEVEYLRSCRNTINLRRVVLPVFISLGEASPLARNQNAPTQSGGEDDGGIASESPSPRTTNRVGLPKKSVSKGLPSGGPSNNQEHGDADDDSPQEEVGNPVEHFRQWLLENVRTITKREQLEPDEDGDIPVDVGSARTYVSPRLIRVDSKNKALSLDIYSILVHGVEKSPDLLLALNRINCETPFVKAKYEEGEKHVVLHHELMADSLSPERLAKHLGMIAFMADAMDTELQRQFGGELHDIDLRNDVQDV
jgi:hypothetical protein